MTREKPAGSGVRGRGLMVWDRQEEKWTTCYKEEENEKQDMEKGPPGSLSVQMSPRPVAHCWPFPEGNPLGVSAIHIPGAPLAPS